MPNPTFRVTPIPDRDDLLAFIRDQFRAQSAWAFDAQRNHSDPEVMHPWDALSLIDSGAENAIAVMDASKDIT